MELMSGDQILIEISLAGAEFKHLIKQWNGNKMFFRWWHFAQMKNASLS